MRLYFNATRDVAGRGTRTNLFLQFHTETTVDWRNAFISIACKYDKKRTAFRRSGSPTVFIRISLGVFCTLPNWTGRELWNTTEAEITRITIPSRQYEAIKLTIGKRGIEFVGGFQFRWHGSDDDSIRCLLEHHFNFCHVVCKRTFGHLKNFLVKLSDSTVLYMYIFGMIRIRSW